MCSSDLNTLIAGIAGVNATRTRGAVSFAVSKLHGKGKQIQVPHAFVLPKVTTDMPANPVGSIEKWKHLKGLDLADPEFGTPGCVDVLLGADHYGEIFLHGRRWGPRGTPYAQRTCFGWVLFGPLRATTLEKAPRVAAHTCCLAREQDSPLRRNLRLKPLREPRGIRFHTPTCKVTCRNSPIATLQVTKAKLETVRFRPAVCTRPVSRRETEK